MKRIVALLLCLLIVASLVACGKSEQGVNDTISETGDALAVAKEWVNKQIEENSLFSFEYDGVPFADFIGDWEKTVETTEDDNGNSVYTLTYESGDGVKAWADITLLADSAAVDYVCYFENTASSASKVISNIQALDSFVEGQGMTLTYPNGSVMTEQDFERRDNDFSEETTVTLTNMGGRSSSGTMPYFDLVHENGGVITCIGWTGQWECTMTKAEDGVGIKAGMEETNISLYANESMRTPSMVLMFYTCDQDEGHNAFRQMILNHYSPLDDNGEPVKELCIFTNAWGGSGVDPIISKLEAYDINGIDYDGLWIDAGWHGNIASVDTYDNNWATQVGNWYVNKNIYPEGMSVIGDTLSSRGKEFLLWFEPERVVLKTDLEVNHPEYVLPYTTAATFTLYNLPSDEATDYLIDMIDGIIKENGVTWYRQDFNCDPISKWQYVDSLEGDTRVGMTEIKYITNLYRYLDTLLERNPGLMIDNCASGGMRLDVEMMKRSVPLWRTDYSVAKDNSNADGVRAINMNLSYWLPLHSGGDGKDGVNDDYEFRSMLASALNFGTITSNFGWYEEKFEEYYKCRPLISSNYYILAQGKGETYNTENCAFMYYSPEQGEGYMMLFRPEGSDVEEQTFMLKGLDEGATYTLTVQDTDQTMEMDGKALMESGITATFPEARSAKFIWITKN